MNQGRITLKDSDSRRGIEEALSHVERGWFPVNSAVLSLVRDRIKDGSYQQRYDLLINDLKKDLGLFTFCLKQVGTVIDGPVQHRSPAEILTSLELEKVESLLSDTRSVLGIHSIDPTQKAQVMRIKHSLISSSTAEVLAERSKLDPTQAFLLATVRQLGLNLVAWNYPRIYAKALAAAAKGDGELEELLFRTLGYSPMELGTRSALEWCQHPDTQAVLRADGGIGGTTGRLPHSKQAERFRTFCEVGEVVSQVHDPEFFPRAIGKWAGAAQEMEKVLGAEGVAIIQARIEQHGGAYAAFVPSGMRVEVNPEKAIRAAMAHLGQRMFERNQFAQRCPPGIVERFRSMYRQVTPGKASPMAVKELVETLIPSLGFERGCIYLVDQKKLQAVPMLRVGDASIDRFRALNCSDAGPTAHPVVEALSYQAPIIQENAFLNGDQVAHVTGTFGNQERVGVLYLEMSLQLREGDRQHILLFFKAVREALNDCLNMQAR